MPPAITHSAMLFLQLILSHHTYNSFRQEYLATNRLISHTTVAPFLWIFTYREHDMRIPAFKLPGPVGQSRFEVILVMFVVAMTVFAVTRATLMIYSLNNVDITMPAILHIFGTGAIYVE